MSFQNRAGGIILDAVLTDTGRKYLARGNFKITKFALGDDEMDYGVFADQNGIVGGTILSSVDTPPIFEAHTKDTAVINYGLLDFDRQDILYIPTLKINDKLLDSITTGTSETYYISANDETSKKLEADLGSRNKFLVSNQLDGYMIVVEAGIDIPSISPETVNPTYQNKLSYILNLDLYDKYYVLNADKRFIDTVFTSPKNSKHLIDSDDALISNLGPLQEIHRCSLPTIDENFEVYQVEGIDNKVYYSASRSVTEHSMFNGPRSTLFSFNARIYNLLCGTSEHTAHFKYSKFGNTNDDLFGSGNLYDFIETTIYIEALTTGRVLQIPLRIIRFSGT